MTRAALIARATKPALTSTYRIWIAGDYQDAIRLTKEFCEEGACFSVAPVDYVYTGGMESGVCVTRINYPRFPASSEQIREQVGRLAEHLRLGLFQDSYTIEGPETTEWVTRRE
jgi:hypothetical protein